MSTASMPAPLIYISSLNFSIRAKTKQLLSASASPFSLTVLEDKMKVLEEAKREKKDII